MIFVTGQSGTGRTTMVGKLTAMLKEACPNKEVITIEMSAEKHRQSTRLQEYGRLLNNQVYTIDIGTSPSDFSELKNTEIIVIDLAIPISQAASLLKSFKGELLPDNISVIATIPASTSSNMISLTMNELGALDPMIALTKLDECDITNAEFSSLATADAKIALFSASRSIVDSPIFASKDVLMQYLSENLESRVQNVPITGKLDS